MIRVGNAPCSWGVLEFDLAGESVGYAQVLDEMAAAGYVGTELGEWGFMPTDPKALREALDQRGLTLISAFVPVDLSNAQAHSPGADTAVRIANLLAPIGGQFIVLADDNGRDPVRTQQAGRITAEMGLDESQWQCFADGVQHIAEAVEYATGLRTVFHHHGAGFVETPAEIETLMRLTDPELVGLCFDTGHYALGGGDPLAGWQQYAERIWLVHFKDYAPEVAQRARAEGWDYFTALRHGIFCELGQGAVPFPRLLEAIQAQGYDGWVVVEQDIVPGMDGGLVSAVRNREYLKSMGI